MATVDTSSHPASSSISTPPPLAPQFDDLDQQRETASLGMWAFLATELMFFGGLFVAYSVYRNLDFPAFSAASRRLNLTLGGINTAVLLTSSLTMALAVRASRTDRRDRLLGFLAATMALGTLFLAIKSFEYFDDWRHDLIPGAGFVFNAPLRASAELFFLLYFLMTGLHAFHMVVGLAIVGTITVLAYRRRNVGEGETRVEMVGLYWHFIDLVWIFLYPLLYLVDAHR